MPSRRDFLSTSAAVAGAAMLQPVLPLSAHAAEHHFKGTMKFSFKPYTLQLKHVFTVAEMSRSTTPVMLTQIEYNGTIGYGEASMPPYLGESHATATEFLSKVDLSKFASPFLINDIMDYVDAIAPHNPAAKASVDIALHDLVGKLVGQPWYHLWGIDPAKAPETTFTIGIDKADVVRAKTIEALAMPQKFKKLKVKLGKDNDKEMVETIRSVTDIPLTADPNNGWTDRGYSVEMAHYLKEKGFLYIEQPMSRDKPDDNAYVTANSPIPILGDEGIQRLPDLVKAAEHGWYNGCVIKLMKTTGLREAFTMNRLAKAFGFKTLFGCMTETSCAVSAAAQLSPLFDWADLDGNLLISNDVFDGVHVVNGKLTLNHLPGIGIRKI